jgi:uncharacterized repeat protein (TIGR03803 family)
MRFCLLMLAASAMSASAQTFTTLISFNGTGEEGSSPFRLVQGLDGNLFGTTSTGGPSEEGTVFVVTPSGAMATLYDFCASSPADEKCPEGAQPTGGLVLAQNGNFYGTTASGGTHNPLGGTVFQITPTGTLSTLYSFCARPKCADGSAPNAPLALSASGGFLGTTSAGQGTIFEMKAPNKFATYNFCPGGGPTCAGGSMPLSWVTQDAEGNVYGTTPEGGSNGFGTIFKIAPTGSFSTLYNFCSLPNCADGASPVAGLTQGADGNFYGVTPYNYTGNCSTEQCGTIFKITPSGSFSTLYTFCALPNCADGYGPSGGIIQASDGNFYGTTVYGGTNESAGTIYRLTPGGMLTTLYTFCVESPCADGSNPFSLVQNTNGIMYGTTVVGGIYNQGTVFSLLAGIAPFVEVLPYAATLGKSVKILGQGLTGTTGVSFNGTAASFTVGADTYLTAAVPVGAGSGFVTVTTPGGTLTSNQEFRVLP